MSQKMKQNSRPVSSLPPADFSRKNVTKNKIKILDMSYPLYMLILAGNYVTKNQENF